MRWMLGVCALLLSCGGSADGNDPDEQVGPNEALLNWNAPTTYVDGTPLLDALAGYRVYMGLASGDYGLPVEIGVVTRYRVKNLTSGVTYYFAVTAFDKAGAESAFSNEVSKQIQ